MLKLQLFHNDKYKKQVSVTSETIKKSTKKKDGSNYSRVAFLDIHTAKIISKLTVTCEVSLMTGEVLYELVLSNLTNLLLCIVVFNAFTFHGFSSSFFIFPSTFHDSSYR